MIKGMKRRLNDEKVHTHDLQYAHTIYEMSHTTEFISHA